MDWIAFWTTCQNVCGRVPSVGSGSEQQGSQRCIISVTCPLSRGKLGNLTCNEYFEGLTISCHVLRHFFKTLISNHRKDVSARK